MIDDFIVMLIYVVGGWVVMSFFWVFIRYLMNAGNKPKSRKLLSNSTNGSNNGDH